MATKNEKFSEELYFMLMSSALSERIRRLAEKYDLNEKPLRKEMLEFGENLPERINIPLTDSVYGLKQAI